MRRFVWFISAVSLFIFTAACQGPGGDLRGATPVGYMRPAVIPVGGETAEPVDIADLVDTPEMYEEQLIEVSGTYYNRQVVVCSTRPQRSPATWALSDGEVRIPAGGLDERLEELPSGRIELTVIGRWLRWQGPVGCGRQAVITEVWYLDLVNVVAPNPVTIAEVGPSDGTLPTDVTVPPDGYPAPDETESEEPQITATEVVTETGEAELPQTVGTPVLLTPSPTSSGGINLPPTPATTNVATATSSTTGSSSTPTATSSAATASPTTANGSPAPTATAGGGGDEPFMVDQKELLHRSIETGELQTNETHRWPLVITSTAVITVNVASQLGLDVGIAIRDPSGNIIAQQNESQGSTPEVMTAISLTESGTYDILITSENDEVGFYAILYLDSLNEDYYTFVFNGPIEVGQSESKDIKANNDHFWHFFGTAGETVTIQVTPSDNSNLFIYLFGVDATVLINFHDETGSGEIEEIISYSLPETGFYSILLGEYSYSASNYTISLISG